jgi:hypothetical protein
MVFQSVNSDNSNAANLNQVNDLARTVRASERTQIFKDDAGTRRVLLGKGLNDFYGLKVSPEGTDVYDAADSDLVFNSNQNVLKIVSSGTHTLTKPVNQILEEDAIAHGLDFIPILVFNIESVTTSPGEWRLGLVMNHDTATGALYSIASANVDATNLSFRAQTPSGGIYYASQLVFNYKYYLLQETAN